MMISDREEVIERLEKVSHYFKSLRAYGRQDDDDIYREHQESVNMAIALLREQDVATDPCKSCQEWECDDCEYAERKVKWND